MPIQRNRTAIYARVSTSDQKVDSQVTTLREYAKHRNFHIVAEFIDEAISGTKDTRPALNKLMDCARKKQIDIVLVFRFDRFGRSTKHLVTALDEFQTLNIDFISYSENIDTSSPIGKVLFTIISAFASFERDAIVERVKAGLHAAKQKGKRLGRPQLSQEIKTQIYEYKSKGLSVRAIAKELGVSKSAVQTVLKS